MEVVDGSALRLRVLNWTRFLLSGRGGALFDSPQRRSRQRRCRLLEQPLESVEVALEGGRREGREGRVREGEA